MSIVIPENYKIVNGTPIVTTNGAVTCDYISVQRGQRVTIVADLLQAATHATALGVNEATSLAGAGAAAMTATVPIWKNADYSATDTLVKGTYAATVAATAGTTNQTLVMQIDPGVLDAGTVAIAATLTASSEATNFASVYYYIEPTYKQATPETMIA